jgi:glyoxylase-like metal-dependent hydrolase (beta-lactamase superfamily II)
MTASPAPGPAARAYELAPDLWSLALPLPYTSVRSVNAYLLETGPGLTLVDCGAAAHPGWELLCDAVAQTGHEITEVRSLVCTHLHADHAGQAERLAEVSGCRLARGAGPANGYDAFRERTVPAEDRRHRAAREGIPAGEVETRTEPPADGRRAHATFDQVLEPGDRLRGRGGEWEVVPVQGHAAAQIALFEAGRRWLISADLVAPEPMLEFGWMEDPVEVHRASLDRIAALDPVCLLPGHGRPIQPVEAVRELVGLARGGIDAMVQRAAAAIADRPHSAYELSERLDRDNPVAVEARQSAMSTSMCLLEHLERSGRAISATGADNVRRFALT